MANYENQAREVQSPKKSKGAKSSKGYSADTANNMKTSGDGTTGTGTSKIHTSVLVNRTKEQSSQCYGKADSGASLYNPSKK